MNEVVMRVEGLSKKFARSLKRAMLYGLGDIARASLIPRRHRSPCLAARLADASHVSSHGQPAREGKRGQAEGRGRQPVPRPESDCLRPSEFWALRDVSFELRRGECLGLIGPNGAGKSTLFSILSGIYDPTFGRVAIRGRLQALIALGAGFHPMLSGRENIYVNAAVFGLTSREINRLMDRIIEFSELGEFIDAPIKTYSSGMLVRLGFSVAAHLDPDILLVDEILAVGDSRFQLKCLNHMRRLVDAGKAQMLVSHYMHNIQGLCERAIWLYKGRIVAMGDTFDVTQRYLASAARAAVRAPTRTSQTADSMAYPVVITSVRMRDRSGAVLDRVTVPTAVELEIGYHAAVPLENLRFYVTLIHRADDLRVFDANMLEEGIGVRCRGGTNLLRVFFPGFAVKPGTYLWHIGARDASGLVALCGGFCTRPFTVERRRAGRGDTPDTLRQVEGITGAKVSIEHTWLFDD